MFCPKCGSEADEAASFCGKCGASFQEGDDGAHSVGVAASAPAFPRKRRRWPLVLVMAVMALLAIGVFAWCQQPGGIERPTRIEVYDSQGQLTSWQDYEYDSEGLAESSKNAISRVNDEWLIYEYEETWDGNILTRVRTSSRSDEPREETYELITSNDGHELELRYLEGSTGLVSSSTRYILGKGGRIEQLRQDLEYEWDAAYGDDRHYDEEGLLVERSSFSSRDGGWKTYSYHYQTDGNGEAIRGSSSDGEDAVSYSYDDQGRLVEVRFDDGRRRVLADYVRIDRPCLLARTQLAASIAGWMCP